MRGREDCNEEGERIVMKKNTITVSTDPNKWTDEEFYYLLNLVNKRRYQVVAK